MEAFGDNPRGDPTLISEGSRDRSKDNILVEAQDTETEAESGAASAPEHRTPNSIEVTAKLRILQIELRNLQREKETLEMEGRRRAAKDQVDARWQERALKDWKQNKARFGYEMVSGGDGGLDAIITGVRYPHDNNHGNGEASGAVVRGNDEHILRHAATDQAINTPRIPRTPRPTSPTSPERSNRTSPKAPKGLKHLAESRRKANNEWNAKHGHRLAVRENDESTRNVLLKNVNRAIAVAEEAVMKLKEDFRGFLGGEGVWEIGDLRERVEYPVAANTEAQARLGQPLIYARKEQVPPLPQRSERDSEDAHGMGVRNEPPEAENRGRDRQPRTRNTSPQSQTLVKAVNKREKQDVIYSSGANIPIPHVSPLTPKIVKQAKPKSSPIFSPAAAIRDSRLLPNENPAQWKVRTQRKAARVEFEKSNDKVGNGEPAAAKPMPNTEQAEPIKGILKRDGKEKGRSIAWVDEPSDDEPTPSKHAPSCNTVLDQEELMKLEQKRQRRDGKFTCLATGSKIERENFQARERAEELAEKIMMGGGGTEDGMSEGGR